MEKTWQCHIGAFHQFGCPHEERIEWLKKGELRRKKIKEILIKFWEDSLKDNPEGKTELIDYDKWVREIFKT